MSSNSNANNGHSTATTIHHPLDNHPLSGGNNIDHTSATATASRSGIAPHSTTPRRRSRRSNNTNNGLGRSAPPAQRLPPKQPSNSNNSKQQQQQQQSSSASNAKRQQAKQLPRSVRWRLSLGLLTKPSTDSNEKDVLLKSIEDLNALKLRFQRSRYDDLEKRHYWKSTPVGIADESNAADAANGGSNAADTTNGGGGGGSRLESVAPGDDPLSALVMQDNNNKNNNNAKSGDRKQPLFGNGIFGNKDKNNAKRGDKRSGGGSFNSGSGSFNSGEGDDEACKGSRWADFYSTREVLDIIEKDLIRLPADHYTVFHEWRLKNKGWMEHRAREEKWNKQQEKHRETLDLINSRSCVNLERAGSGGEEETVLMDESSIGSDGQQSQSSGGGNNGNKQCQAQSSTPSSGGAGKQHQPTQSSSGGMFASLNLGRLKGAKSMDNMAALLQVEEEEEDEEVRREENAKAEIQTSITERAGRISQILFVYAREHPEIGYRQGMHEVLSNILLALEMDLLEQAIINERKRWRKDSLSFGIQRNNGDAGANGGMAGVDSSGKIVKVQLLDASFLLHDTFNLFECIMTSLAPAYDAIPAGDETTASILEEAKMERGESPMELMTSSIVSKIRFVARDEQLFGHVLYMPVPPQLYFAKWIRLMFGREVAGGMKGVLTLWGAFFDLAAAKASSDEEIPITAALLDVLKTAAAAMIILIRHKLLAPSMGYDGMMTGEPDPNVGIGYLMNYPPLKDIGTLVETISNLLAREQKLSNQYQVAKERKFSKQYLPSETYKISSITEDIQSGDELDSSERSLPFPQRMENSSSSLQYSMDGDGQQQSDFTQKLNDELPRVYKPGGPSHNQQPTQHDVAESLGHIAEGLFDLGSKTVDFGSKTASAAIASIQKQYDVRRQNAVDHPLQNNHGFVSIDSSGRDEREDFVIQYRPHVSPQTTQPKLAVGHRVPLAGDDATEKNPLQHLIEGSDAGETSDDEDVSVEDGLDQSVKTNLSYAEAKDIGDSIQKSPRELATILEKSVGALMKHFNERLSADMDSRMLGDSSHSGANIDMSHHSISIIPDDIWDALADIDLVKKELLSQAAIASMDHARSCSSLRSSGNSGNSASHGTRRRGKSTSEARKSWVL